MSHRRYLIPALLLTLAAALSIIALAARSSGTVDARKTVKPVVVDLYGDSILAQAGPYIRTDFNLNGAKINLTALGGIPLCYWLPPPYIGSITTDNAPQVAVIESAGDIFTSCMSGHVEPDSVFIAKYKADLTAAIRHFLEAGTEYIVVTPAPAAQIPTSRRDRLDHMFKDVVAGFDNARITYAQGVARSVETPTGAYAQYLPCLRIEKDAGNCSSLKRGNEVRSPDGIHFCPTNRGNNHGQVDLCPVYSSGAYRYALSLAQIIWRFEPKTKPATLPTVSSISPHVGSAKGDNTVYVYGANLSRVKRILYKSVNGNDLFGWSQVATSSDITVMSDRELRIVVPSLYDAPTPGVTIYITVKTKDSQSFWEPITELSYSER